MFCSLKAWEILPESNYYESGHEIEMMEAEVKDSEDETEEYRDTEQLGVRNDTDSSSKLQAGRGMSTSKGSDLTMPVRKRFDINQQTSAAKDLLHATENTTSKTSIKGLRVGDSAESSSKHQYSGKQAKRKDGDLLTSKADQAKEVVGGVINEERTNMVEAKRRLCHASKACESKTEMPFDDEKERKSVEKWSSVESGEHDKENVVPKPNTKHKQSDIRQNLILT